MKPPAPFLAALVVAAPLAAWPAQPVMTPDAWRDACYLIESAAAQNNGRYSADWLLTAADFLAASCGTPAAQVARVKRRACRQMQREAGTQQIENERCKP